MDIKIGDRVKLDEESQYNKSICKSNPINTLGTYVSFGNNGSVKWDNGYENNCYGRKTYKSSELIFVSRPLKIHELWN